MAVGTAGGRAGEAEAPATVGVEAEAGFGPAAADSAAAGSAPAAGAERTYEAVRAAAAGSAPAAGAGRTHEAVRSAAEAEALLLAVVAEHGDALLRVAEASSWCLDDAHDAYQRSLERFLRCGRRLERATAHGWLFTVLKREARAIRSARSDVLGDRALDPDRLAERHEDTPEDRALDAEASARGAEALRSLKPQETLALWLRADGRSYAEIQEVTGWTYTKVNRSLREGRKAYLQQCAELEAGAACGPYRDVLTALAAGRAGAAELAGARPHLRRCAACRATLRELRAAPRPSAVVYPPALAGTGLASGGLRGRLDGVGRALGRLHEALVGPLHDRAVTGALQWQAAVEAATGGKLAVVAVSTVALAGGGAAARHDARHAGSPRPPERAASARSRSAPEAASPAARPGRPVAPATAPATPAASGAAARSPAPAARAAPVAPADRAAPAAGEFGAATPAGSDTPAEAEFGGAASGPTAAVRPGDDSTAAERPGATGGGSAAAAGPGATGGGSAAAAGPGATGGGSAAAVRPGATGGGSAAAGEFGP